MANQGQAAAVPPWLREDHLEEAPLNSPTNPSLVNPANPAGTVQKTPEQEKRAKTIHWSLRIITMALCILMCATAVIGVGKWGSLYSFGIRTLQLITFLPVHYHVLYREY